MKKRRTALVSSILALLLCVSMLMGTTLAWFTDGVSSQHNQILAGSLDVELEQYVDGKWVRINESTNVFEKDTLWEPGHTEVVYLRIVNAGDLALKYGFGVNVAKETGSVNVEGENFKLSDHIRYGIILSDSQVTYADRYTARAALQTSQLINQAYTSDAGALYPVDNTQNLPSEKYVTMVVYMPEEVGNEANYATGAAIPTIELGLRLMATQEVHESDSFGSDYDASAEIPSFNFPDNVFNDDVTVPVEKDNEGKVSSPVTLQGNRTTAEVPAGVLLADGVDALNLTTGNVGQSQANLILGENESQLSVDVHIEGVSADNTVPMTITLEEVAPKGLNMGNYKAYHVENGQTVEMTYVASDAAFTAHNQFKYDPATGDMVLYMATFSEFAVTADTINAWNGEVDIDWYQDGETAFEIFNADQLAGLGKLVDEGKDFAGKTVTLCMDVVLSDGNHTDGTKSFDPIGFGYAYNTNGRAFKGIFDGNGNTVYNLYQNGWAMGEAYSYSTAGGGLFASVYDATIKNLTMDNAYIVMECVDMGTVVGYAQGNCTFENIVVRNSTLANYQRYTGGVIGEVSNGHHTLNNVDVEASTTIGSLWGDFDNASGGLIGGKWGHNNDEKTGNGGHKVSVEMKNCDVAAKLDVYNDVTSAYQWYSYRRCGMLIGMSEESQKDGNGRTEATASYLTTENCTVQYGDWANYHYCEFGDTTSLGARYPWVRVEKGNFNGAYSNPRYGVPTFENATLDVENHTEKSDCHVGDDGHHVEIVFNQLYGGGQGCYGGNSHLGEGSVTVRSQTGEIKPTTKFESTGVKNIQTGSTVALGDLFQAAAGADIKSAYVYAFVSPANEASSVGITSVAPKADGNWEEMEITFSGEGAARIVITDYNYCQATVLYVTVGEVVIPTYTVTLVDAYGTHYEQNVSTTDGILLENANHNEYTFLHWSEKQTNGEAETAPEQVTLGADGKYHPESDITLYAVYSGTKTVEGETVYKKVTATPSDWSGEYLIVYEAGKVAFNGALTKLDAVSNTVPVTITNNTIASNDTVNGAIFTIAKNGTSYTIQSASGYYIGNTADSNALSASTATKYTNTITLNNDKSVQIVGSGKSVLRYNAASDQNRFRYYKSSTYTGQKAIALYEKVEIDGESTTYYITFKEAACKHTNTTTVTVNATCTEAGSITETCDNCGKNISTSVIAALGHSYGNDDICDTCGFNKAEITKSYTFADYTAGTQYAEGEEHKLDDDITVTTTQCHFTTQLRIYGSEAHNGYAIIEVAEGKGISGMSFEATYNDNAGTLNVYGSNDEGVTWELIQGVAISTNGYNNYVVDFDGKTYTSLKLDVANNTQIRLQNMTLKIVGASGESGGETGGETTEGTWQLVTDASTLKAGDQIVIAAVESYVALSTTQNGNNRGQAGVTKNGTAVTFGDDVQTITLEVGNKSGTFAFDVGNGYLYAASSSSNYLRTEQTLSDNSSWMITIAADGTATIIAQGSYTRKVMQHNQSSGLFACYASASQQAICIYKLVE